MLLIALLFVSNTFAADCQPDGDHAATCQTGKCEAVGSSEICTQCRAGGAPIDGFCRPVGSPQVIAAGCTKGDGSALEGTATTCGKCGSGYFLFMGGCYRTGSQPGSEICTAAEGGKCTVCNTANGLFKNPAAAPDAGRECLFCWDTAEINGITGVVGCSECSHIGTSGPVTCSACNERYFLDGARHTCTQCINNCETCTGAGATNCKTCKAGFYLKDGNTCVAEGSCTDTAYPDLESGICKACTTIHEQCTACSFDKANGRPKCTACGGSQILKTELDGTVTCVVEGQCAAEKTHFVIDESGKKCVPCSDVTTGSTDEKQGVANCRTCTSSPSQKPICETCLDGYYGTTSCTECDANCATCNSAGAAQCQTCKPGYFLKGGQAPAECVACDSTTDSGISGCAICTFDTSLTCNSCKPDYALIGSGCQKSCEDDTGCGGASGACDATIIDGQGNAKHYCSYCGKTNDVPIDGRCVANTQNQGNTGCTDHVCTQCTTGYFLYMGGCYSVSTAPSSHMCKTADGGVCTEAASDKYFAVPGAAKTGQSVLACGNPLGTAVDDKTYVGVEGCSQCTAPAQLDAPGMASATCTACGEGRKPSKSGTGCAACSDANCRHCRVDGVCEECSSGFSLEGGKCVSTGGPNLSTEAIAGISVAAIVVVGGLVGFLCWWFLCRGKA
ncbi:VSP [Giardia lamblia P15]|uniref:VSP n=1 Tax=Giardia intestinalis (strain P15) TaxID=658858 RepID=E1EX68_GIAIA|nr:VSP [Giardia lamblia P15]